ncbi:MAG: hypothetical protein HC845_01915, partial [Akkermansiaceae bacterium]|nr:hypothetical protein [Akkermansiaceae bacterium]
GSQPAVTLTPVKEEDLEISPRIPLSALASFDAEIEGDRKAGRLKKLGHSAKEAAEELSRS